MTKKILIFGFALAFWAFVIWLAFSYEKTAVFFLVTTCIFAFLWSSAVGKVNALNGRIKNLDISLKGTTVQLGEALATTSVLYNLLPTEIKEKHENIVPAQEETKEDATKEDVE